jgi:hypothetical protein
MAVDRMSEARLAHRRGINRITAAIAAGAVVATGVFAAAAAHTTRAASSSADGNGVTGETESTFGWSADEGSGSTLTPSQSAPSQSFGPPVARSGGS